MKAPSTSSAESWSRLAAWRAQHRAAAQSSWQKLRAQPLTTGLVWLVIAISFALPSTLLLTLDNLQLVAPDTETSVRLSVLHILMCHLVRPTHCRIKLPTSPTLMRCQSSHGTGAGFHSKRGCRPCCRWTSYADDRWCPSMKQKGGLSRRYCPCSRWTGWCETPFGSRV